MLYCKFQSKRMGLLLLCVFTTFLFTSNVVAQQNKLIEALDILGNRRLTDEDILRHIKTRPGEQFNAKQAQEDLQSLLKLGLFDTSQTRVFTEVGVRGGVNLIFEIRELPLIVELKFDGLRYVTKEEVLVELREQKAEVTANSPYQPEKLRKARVVILEYLAKKRGFVDAKVDFTEEEVSATTVKISFVIDEMPNDEEDCCEK
jgi:outer membrane protein insertion porin family